MVSNLELLSGPRSAEGTDAGLPSSRLLKRAEAGSRLREASQPPGSFSLKTSAAICHPEAGGRALQGLAAVAEVDVRLQAISSLRQLLLFDPVAILSEGRVRLPESERSDVTPSLTNQTLLGRNQHRSLECFRAVSFLSIRP